MIQIEIEGGIGAWEVYPDDHRELWAAEARSMADEGRCEDQYNEEAYMSDTSDGGYLFVGPPRWMVGYLDGGYLFVGPPRWMVDYLGVVDFDPKEDIQF